MAYLQHYWKDVKRSENVSPGWGTKSDLLHRQVNQGDVIWVVVTGGPSRPSEWRLLQSIVVGRKYIDADNEYAYRVHPAPNGNEIFDPRVQVNLEPLLKSLTFVSGHTIQLSGARIGQALQTMRPLTETDGKLLRQYAAGLETVKRI